VGISICRVRSIHDMYVSDSNFFSELQTSSYKLGAARDQETMSVVAIEHAIIPTDT
jgi:hypothetical protein